MEILEKALYVLEECGRLVEQYVEGDKREMRARKNRSHQ